MEDLKEVIRSVLKGIPTMDRFTVHCPALSLQDPDVLNVHVDYYLDKPPHLTYCIDFHKSKMQHLSAGQVAKYVEMKLRFAVDGILKYAKEISEESDG